MNPDDDLENEEFDGLQSYARKGMAQELAKKLGLLADVPGADSDDSADGSQPDGQSIDDAAASGDTDAQMQQGKNGSTDGIDIDELLKILQKAQ